MEFLIALSAEVVLRITSVKGGLGSKSQMYGAAQTHGFLHLSPCALTTWPRGLPTHFVTLSNRDIHIAGKVSFRDGSIRSIQYIDMSSLDKPGLYWDAQFIHM